MLYKFARDYCGKHGIILADCKFEFGLIDGEIILIDEILRRIPPVSGMRRITR